MQNQNEILWFESLERCEQKISDNDLKKGFKKARLKILKELLKKRKGNSNDNSNLN